MSSSNVTTQYIHRIYDSIVVTQDGRVGVATTPTGSQSLTVSGATSVQDFTATSFTQTSSKS